MFFEYSDLQLLHCLYWFNFIDDLNRPKTLKCVFQYPANFFICANI